MLFFINYFLHVPIHQLCSGLEKPVHLSCLFDVVFNNPYDLFPLVKKSNDNKMFTWTWKSY